MLFYSSVDMLGIFDISLKSAIVPLKTEVIGIVPIFEICQFFQKMVEIDKK